MAYDGSARWDAIETGLRREGFLLRFSCAYFDAPPSDLGWTGRETGWETRRLIARWCATHGVEDYRIVRNTSYRRDLHGPAVYELWTRTAPAAPARPEPTTGRLPHGPAATQGGRTT
jgi:hypothetical protein